MFLDLATQFDPVALRADLAFDGTDLVLDTTAATPIIIALGADRRARPDDTLPQPISNPLAPPALNVKRGWAGDALDSQGRLTGSRLWLLQTMKLNEKTVLLCESMLSEALQFFTDSYGLVVSVKAGRLAKNILGFTCNVGPDSVSLQLPVLG